MLCLLHASRRFEKDRKKLVLKAEIHTLPASKMVYRNQLVLSTTSMVKQSCETFFEPHSSVNSPFLSTDKHYLGLKKQSCVQCREKRYNSISRFFVEPNRSTWLYTACLIAFLGAQRGNNRSFGRHKLAIKIPILSYYPGLSFHVGTSWNHLFVQCSAH